MKKDGLAVAAALAAALGSGAVEPAAAAPGDHLWSQGWNVQGRGAATDGAGAVSCAGTFSGTVSLGGASLVASGIDVFVAKLDGDGNHIWSGAYDATAPPTVTAVACAPAGDTYVAGNLPKGGTIDFGGGPIGTTFGDMWAVRFDPNGNHVWSATYGRGQIQDIDATDAAVAFAVRNNGPVDFGGGPLGASGTQAIAAVLTPAGDHVWSDEYGDGSFQEAREVGLLPTGELVFLAAVQGTIDFGGGGLAADASADLALAKFDASGGHLWSRIEHATFGSPSILYTGMDVTDAGAIAITGEFSGSLSFGGGTFSSTLLDIFVGRFDSTGNHVWSTSFGSAADETGMSVWFAPSGDLVLAGTYGGAALDLGGGALPWVGGRDAFVASIGPGGTHLWSRGFGTTSSESRCEAEGSPQGDAILDLNGGSSLDFGGGPVAGTFALAKLEGGSDPGPVAAPVEVAGRSGWRLEVAPNPFATATTIRLAAPERAPQGAVLRVMDVAGRRVRSFPVGAGGEPMTIHWDGASDGGAPVAPGVYYLKLDTENGTATRRVVRVR
jgi:hypothetical protein